MTAKPADAALGPAPPPGKYLIAAILTLLSLIWGTTWSVIQIGLVGVPPLTGVSLRFGLAGVLLLVMARARGVPLGRSSSERRLWWVNTTFAFCGSFGIVYWAEQWVPSGLTAVLFATYPLFVALLAWWFLPDEPLGLMESLAILVGFGGVLLIFSEDLRALGGPAVARASLVLLIAPFVSAIASVAVKRHGAGIHPLSLAGVPMLGGSLVMGALALIFERDRVFTWNAASIGAIVYLAVVGSAVTFSLYYWMLALLPAKRVALISYVVPVIAVIIGVLRGEALTARMLAGAVLVVGGVTLATQRPRLADRFRRRWAPSRFR